jgi:hypothetical protein
LKQKERRKKMSNPYYDTELMLMENPKPARRRSTTETVSLPLLVALGYGGWVLFGYFKNKTWNWTPWRSISRRPQLTAGRSYLPMTMSHVARPASNRVAEPGYYSQFMKADTWNTLENYREKPERPARDIEKERISFILP